MADSTDLAELDLKLRNQINLGCNLVHQLEEMMKSIPSGKLITEAELRSRIAMASSHAVSVLSEAMRMLLDTNNTNLNNNNNNNNYSNTMNSINAVINFNNHNEGVVNNNGQVSKADAKSTPAGSGGGGVSGKPVTSPHSAAGMISPRGGGNSCSGFSNSGGSPESSSAANLSSPRKRKPTDKITYRIVGITTDQLGEAGVAPPEDGHTWRKYGQKAILGSRYQRSYFRCTHKTDAACPALKHVQRCDHDPSSFDVTYKGRHTCRPAELDSEQWPFAYARPDDAAACGEYYVLDWNKLHVAARYYRVHSNVSTQVSHVDEIIPTTQPCPIPATLSAQVSDSVAVFTVPTSNGTSCDNLVGVNSYVPTVDQRFTIESSTSNAIVGESTPMGIDVSTAWSPYSSPQTMSSFGLMGQTNPMSSNNNDVQRTNLMDYKPFPDEFYFMESIEPNTRRLI